jgi:hypothetical protein
MYAADLTTLLKILQEIQANEVISTAGMGPGESWCAQLILTKGHVTHCSVHTRVNGQCLLTDGEALGWLARLGNLIWKPQVSTRQLPALLPPPAVPVPHQGQEVPRRLGGAEPVGMQSWSRKQRQVFALVDGRRSTQRIVAILCQPPEVVAALLNDLRSMGVIAREQ